MCFLKPQFGRAARWAAKISKQKKNGITLEAEHASLSKKWIQDTPLFETGPLPFEFPLVVIRYLDNFEWKKKLF